MFVEDRVQVGVHHQVGTVSVGTNVGTPGTSAAPGHESPSRTPQGIERHASDSLSLTCRPRLLRFQLRTQSCTVVGRPHPPSSYCPFSPSDPSSPSYPQDGDSGPDRRGALLAECRVETFRSGGPGGQHANTTDSAVRLTHLPTGIQVTVRTHRSQHRNREEALEKLQHRLEDLRRPRKKRVQTRVPAREKRKRLEAKRRRGEVKRKRKRPLRGLLRRIHGSAQHSGKLYISDPSDLSDRQGRISSMRRQLQRAVEIEDFETAAELRDRIHDL